VLRIAIVKGQMALQLGEYHHHHRLLRQQGSTES